MPDNPFFRGEAARLSLAIADLSGNAADPGTLVLKIKTPSGSVTPYTFGSDAELVRDSLGNYHADIPLDASGQWAYRWELTTPNAGAAEGVLHVRKSYVLA